MSEAGNSRTDASDSGTGTLFAAVILAAGSSARLGRPKMLLPWGKETVISHLVHLWQWLGASQLIVVIKESDGVIRDDLDQRGITGVQCIVNPDAQGGMFTSIQAAARWERWHPDLTHWAIILGDQPHVSEGTLRKLISVLPNSAGAIGQPSRAGRPRHPVFLPSAAFAALRTTSHPTLKHFLSSGDWPVNLLEIDDEALDSDIDTMEDYDQILVRFPPA